ncbi:hypothetical protein DNTS_020412 [Danionella cerebrum]|uniref:C2H2-type domain-containing protein n=1 Tax=Danionella cerebrum TaxID=2873325 RepID=A0A553QM97_9TELE|nr:hypothetical protein DNTS_020412 [Danionella translucida]
MSAQSVYPPLSGIFLPLPEESQDLPDMNRNDIAAPQLVMLANVVVSEASAAELNSEEKQMVELQTVACSSYSDSEDDEVERGVVRYRLENPELTEESYVERSTEIHSDISEHAHAKIDPKPSSKDQLDAPSPSEKRKRSPVITFDSSKKKQKPFFCKPCHFQAENEEEFIGHIRTHGAKKIKVVNGADESDDDQTVDMNSNQTEGGDTANSSKGVIRCERCGYNTNRFDHYMAHLKHHTKEGEEQRVFKCTICAYTTISQYHWKKHLRNHFPSKLFTCNQCSYFSDRKNNYVQHIRTHTGERPFQCIYCSYSSSQKTHLTRHMRTHSGERPFKCDNCSYLAANQHEVTRHARQVHNGPKPLSCPYCEYKTADRSNFKKHVELHVNPRQFLCPVCKYAASKKCNLQYHIKSRHPGCTEISMDVSKVRLRVKKNDADEVPGNKATAEVKQSEGKKLGDVNGVESGPINLSIRKTPSKPSPVVETTEKSSKRNQDIMAKEHCTKKNLQSNEKTTREKRTRVKGKSLVKNMENGVRQAEDKQVNKKGARKAEKPLTSLEKTKRFIEEPGKSSVSAGEVEKTKSVEKHAQTELAENDKSPKSIDKQPKLSTGEEKSLKPAEDAEKLPNMVKKPEKSLKGTKKAPKKPKSAQKPIKTTERTINNNPNKERLLEENSSRAVEKGLDLEKETPEKELQVKQKESQNSKVQELLERENISSVENTRTKQEKKAKDYGKPQTKKLTTQQAEARQEIKSKAVKRKAEDGAAPKGNVATKKLKSIKKGTTKQTSKPADSERNRTISEVFRAQNSKTGANEPNSSVTVIGSTSEDIQQNPVQAQENTATVELCHDISENDSSLEKESIIQSKPQNQKEIKEVAEVDSGVEMASPTDSEGTPTFTPNLVFPRRSNDAEDDEGIHSHDGGSDISDCVSEGSYDSGLNGIPNNGDSGDKPPETPTQEIPCPAKSQSHTCIFCDRSFPLESDYRRHLNRHLVNVYYLEEAAQADRSES